MSSVTDTVFPAVFSASRSSSAPGDNRRASWYLGDDQRAGGVLPSLILDYLNGRYSVDSKYSTFDGAQTFSRSSTATGVSPLGLITGYLADEQRLEYSTGTRGLLIEESRTNLVNYSIIEELGTKWFQAAGDPELTGNATIAPDGTNTASFYYVGTGSTYGYINPNDASVTDGLYYTFSVYAKTAG